jgi:16S rRNA (cytosine1402-N4)-methyltransferase
MRDAHLQPPPHVPVLLYEVMAALVPNDRAPQRVIDGTLGAGGHSEALLQAGAGHVLGIDLDPHARAIAAERLAPYAGRFTIAAGSYAAMQFDTPARGFAFRHDAPLDMRFDPTAGPATRTAADLLNTLSADSIADLLWRYGEEHESRRIAYAIVRARAQTPITGTRQLAELVARVMPPSARRRDRRSGVIHPATRTFQALRIAVNDELGTISRALPRALDLLAPRGRLAVISFHSLEDRLVKDTFRLAATDCICPPRVPVCVCGHRASVNEVVRKPITASAEEQALNPRARSAKLRVVEKRPTAERT